MNPETHTIERLTRANRRLRFGYLVVAALGLAAYSLSTPAPTHAGPSDPDGNNVKIDINKVGDLQSITAVHHESGFAVLVDEEGKINIIHHDGKVIVPTRKRFEH